MPQDLSAQQRIINLLQNFRGTDPLKELFWSELNYDRQNAPIPRIDWNQRNISNTADDPLLFATGGENSDFHLIYTRLDSERLLLTAERPIISRLLRDYPNALFIFSNREQTDWHFVNPKYDEEHPEKRRLYRRITIGRSEKLRTASERIALLDAESLDSPLEIQNRHDEAFDVEAVTNEFFKSYQSVFQRLQTDLTNQTNDNQWAHDFALQFLNRCMFLYFIQRKGWLGDDTEFLKTFWDSYRTTNQRVDSFVEHWLNVMFFEAFNNKFHGGHRQFPDEIRRALASAPFLNGGLFTENDLDNRHEFQICDASFESIFNFLEGYNFTIAEDSPLDQEVAVDPEMIGKVY
ncbi:MAG: class I SAM-dependent DNA methyltransferase, partial [Candidatus Poribacteria bacterium]|nr:class I SAM-dependent DNA methyltransferase [Candidatus Poribacteria bacterium]